MMEEPGLNFYRQAARMTDLSAIEDLLTETPQTLSELVKMIQGLMLHIFWVEREGFQPSEERKAEVNYRLARSYFKRALELDPAPFTQPRPIERKVIGNCRDFAVILCALLRRLNIPARARAGFGRYFIPGHYEDHWICEYWHADQQRWVMVDAQLNPMQVEMLKIDFDPLDVPADLFWTSERTWLAARAGEIDPEKCGIFEFHGMDFIRGSLGLSFGALNKFEVLPWEGWGLFYQPVSEVSEDDLSFLDELARKMVDCDRELPELQQLFAEDPRLQAADFQHKVFSEE